MEARQLMNLVYFSILLEDMISLIAGTPDSQGYAEFKAMLKQEKDRRGKWSKEADGITTKPNGNG